MTHAELAVLFAVVGLILLAAEVLLPSHGILGLLAGSAFVTSVVYCFLISATLGAVVFAALCITGPIVALYMVDFWPQTPIGRRLVLPKVAAAGGEAGGQLTMIGQRGIAITELRPVGVCEFGGARVEAVSQLNIIGAGSGVEIVALDGVRPVVRPIA
jgi:membrane-bound serine protease (ClpP class)